MVRGYCPNSNNRLLDSVVDERYIMDVESFEIPSTHLDKNTIYIIMWGLYITNARYVNDIISKSYKIVLFSGMEGFRNIIEKTEEIGLDTYRHIIDYNVPIICTGDLDDTIYHLNVESLFQKTVECNTGIIVSDIEHRKPRYKFLFLNGRRRHNRVYLFEYFRRNGLLDDALWSFLDDSCGQIPGIKQQLIFGDDAVDRIPVPKKLLDASYEQCPSEITEYDGSPYEKTKRGIFGDVWGDGMIVPKQYEDTYFSVVVETEFGNPYSFRTEKIWKPILASHPWIAVSNYGYYRDIREIGFKTFDGIIDESFDLIKDNQKRIEYIARVITDLCNQNLDDFLVACGDICAYNRKHALSLCKDIEQTRTHKIVDFLKNRFT